jgi:hypothetical protein
MRSLALALVGWLAAVCALRAQVSVDLLLEQKQFLRDESLPVKVRVTNRSGQTLRLGQDADWLHFAIEHRDGHPLRRQGEVDVTGEFTLESASVADRIFNLMPHFDLGMPGRYRVTALLKIKDWGVTVSSPPAEFDIIQGSKIWEEDFGVPAPEGPPEPRKYILQQAAHTKELRLYARVTDLAEHRVFRVVALGPLVSFSRPEAQIDKQSSLHALFQTGARSFYYTVVDPDGALVVRHTYDYTATRPVLRVDKEGKIFVAGGVRRPSRDDLPPRTLEEILQEAQATNQVALTNLTVLTVATNSPPATNDTRIGKKARERKAAREAGR